MREASNDRPAFLRGLHARFREVLDMSLARFAKRTDTTQEAIVKALRAAGWLVWVISKPCDLLCWKAGRFQALEVKTPYGKKQPKARTDKRQKEQIEFLQATGAPVVTSPMEALLAVGEKVEVWP